MSSPQTPGAPDRFPCRACAEQIPTEARICHHCQTSALVDVVLRAPVTNPRQRHQTARALQALPGAPVLLSMQESMIAKQPFVARGVTRAFAEQAIGILAAEGVRASIEQTAAEAVTGSSLGKQLRAVGAVVVILMGATAWRIALHSKLETSAPAAAAPAGQPAPGASSPATLSPRDLAQRSLPSAVSLRCRASVGSGFFVAQDLVLTNAHVLCPKGERIQVVMSDGRKMLGDVQRADTDVDLGLVHVVGAHEKPLPLGDVADLAAGDTVMIIGSPIGLEFTTHQGNVSSLSRYTHGIAYVQLDAKINPGNSGGPVIDDRGRVVGLVTLKATAAEGIGLALPINYAYGQLAFVAAPSPSAATSAPFAKMIADARAAGWTDKKTADNHDIAGQPDVAQNGRLLAGADVDEYDRLVVRILRIQDAVPGYEEVTVKFWNGPDNVCTVKGDVSDWRDLEPGGAGSGLSTSSIRALKNLGAGRLFIGAAPLRWDLCDRKRVNGGIEIEAVGANPEANRMSVNVYRRYSGSNSGGTLTSQAVP